MRTVVKFDKFKDIQEVDQFGFVDLTKSISEGFVPNDIGISAEAFDGQDIDPESLLGKPSDVFEAMRIQDSLAHGVSKRSQNEAKDSDSYNKTEKS